MDLYEKIKELAAQKHTSIRKIEEHLGYGNGTIRRWNKNKPNYDKIQAVAKYFNVSVDYLLGNEQRWSANARSCSGINRGKRYSAEEIQDLLDTAKQFPAIRRKKTGESRDFTEK